MVQILRKCEYTQRSRDEVTVFPANEVIYEDSAASFDGLNLSKVELKCANLDDLDLRGADFSGAALFGSSLQNTQLSGAKFCRADMYGCNLTGALLGDVDFSYANLLYAHFSDCDMSKANFEGAHLEYCFYNDNTIWPAGITPESITARRWEDWLAERKAMNWDPDWKGPWE